MEQERLCFLLGQLYCQIDCYLAPAAVAGLDRVTAGRISPPRFSLRESESKIRMQSTAPWLHSLARPLATTTTHTHAHPLTHSAIHPLPDLPVSFESSIQFRLYSTFVQA